VAPRLASPTPWLLLLCPFIARVARRPSLMRRASSRRFIARASPHIHVRVHLLSVLAVCGPCPSSPPAAESILAQIPRSLGAIILQAAWDCCGIWPSPSRARPPSCPSTPDTRIHAARLCCAMASLCCLSLCLSMPHGMLSMPVECCSHVLSPSFWAVLRASRRRLIRLDRLRARVPELGS
jgi:hypothetical protein